MAGEIIETGRLISDWTKNFASIYSRSDKGRGAEEFWIATMAHSSVIGESIRRVDYPQLMKAAAHTFCWMCCYVNYCNTTDDLLFYCKHSLCDIVFFKFPNVCGHCREIPCKCDPFKMDSQKDKAADYMKLLERWKDYRRTEGHRIKEWLNMFRDIYGGRIHLLTLESIGFHFLEEAGEEAKAVRQLVQMRGVLDGGIEGLDRSFLQEISGIEKLVEEYKKCERDEEGKPKIKMDSNALEHVKTRIVKAKMDFFIELADTFSWFCAILIKMLGIIKNNRIGELDDYNLEVFLEKEYKASSEGLKCPTCDGRPCKCIFFPAFLSGRRKE